MRQRSTFNVPTFNSAPCLAWECDIEQGARLRVWYASSHDTSSST